MRTAGHNRWRTVKHDRVCHHLTLDCPHNDSDQSRPTDELGRPAPSTQMSADCIGLTWRNP